MTKEISFGPNFGEAIVNMNGTRLEVHTDGSVDAYTGGTVRVHPAANEASPLAASSSPERKPGDRMADGSIYAGVSPDTGKPMYATPADAPLTYIFNHAQKFAAKLEAHGHQDWRVPTKDELNVLYNNRAAIGGFDESGSYPAGLYWSSSQNGNNDAWAQRFSDGCQYDSGKVFDSSLRCVR